MEITLEWSAPTFWRAQGLERALLKSLRMGGRDAIRTMKSQGNKQVRARKKLKVSRVNRGMQTTTPVGASRIEDLVWTMSVDNAPIRLADYPHKQGAAGTTVQVNVGSKKLIKSAFEAKMRSGHVGVFMREGKARLKIDELFTSRLTDVFKDNGMIPALQAQTQTAFQKTFDRVFPTECAKVR
jgi:hypothetical protein